ncbi:MAG TPA: D-cysteine desulfhydrase family protein [Firmicutes bacterium]|nr:D-cysteine desulfhydrase family protein [Candidatus Fermentithermobacillaceae bacterium]
MGFPRAKLAETPTPFEEAPRFSKAVGGPKIFLKRDDATGLALGGNKARKLELLMGEALKAGADTVITCGGPQSNHARMTAAAARKLGLHPVLVLDGDDPGTRQGNLLIDHLLGAEIIFSGERSSGELLDEVRGRVAARGRKPYVIPLGGSSPLGALAYIECVEEIVSQCRQFGIAPKALYVAAGSVGTLAGLIMGKVVFEAGFSVKGIAVSPGADAKAERTVGLMEDAISLLKSRAPLSGAPAGLSRLFDLSREDLRGLVSVDESQVGEGYAIPTEAGLEAIRLLARSEGVLTDPVYTGKALAGLIKDARSGMYSEDDSLIFVHTGGVPADFAFTNVLVRN